MTLNPKKIAALTALGILLIVGAALWLFVFERAPEETPAEEPAETGVAETEEADQDETAEKENDTEKEEPEYPGNRANILLLGFDERGLSDAIVIISYDIETFETAFIAIKRDTYVDFQTWSPKGGGHSALGWASYVGMGYGGDDYRGGARYMAETIEELLGIRITSYAGITFDGFVELIDSLGGVKLEVDPRFAERNTDPLTPGHRLLSGEEALIFARHRQDPRIPEPGSQSEDGDRVRRNQQLLHAAFERCRDLSTDELLDIYEQMEDQIHTNMERWDLLTLANIFYNKDPELIDKVVLPGEHETVYEEKLGEEIEYYFLNEEESAELLQELGLK